MKQLITRCNFLNKYTQSKLFVTLLTFSVVASSCNYRLALYLKPKSLVPVTYNYFFIKSNDPVYRNLDAIFGNHGKGDTVVGKLSIFYKTIEIGSDKIYYVINVEDTAEKDPAIGPNLFLHAAMIFSGDSVLLALIDRKNEVRNLKKTDFDQYLPTKVKRSDTLVIVDRGLGNNKRNLFLYDFKMENLVIDGKKLKNCLAINIMEKWPDNVYTGKVWLHKEYGVVQWLRITDRLDQRKF